MSDDTPRSHLNSVIVEGVVSDISPQGITLVCTRQFKDCQSHMVIWVRCDVAKRPGTYLGCTVRVVGRLSMDVRHEVATLAVYPEYIEVQPPMEVPQ